MAGISWGRVFATQYPKAPVSEASLRSCVSRLLSPLTDDEIAEIAASQSNPFPALDPLHDSYRPFDARNWRLPGTPLPPSYLDFLRWSNGGTFGNGSRTFDPIFAVDEVRDLLLSYHIPQYMPGAVPFALDGGGNFYLFDMRRPPTDGEYPVLFAAAGDLGYADAAAAGDSLLDACTRLVAPGA